MPPNRLTTSAVPRFSMVVPIGVTERKKNSQSRVVGLNPFWRFTIASCGTSWMIVPTGYRPPLGELATASAWSRWPSRLST